MTPNQQLASLLLGEPVEAWILARRERGQSWRVIARDLYTATNGRVDVAHQTLVNWTESDAA